MKNFIIVILVLAVLGLGGFIIYDKTIAKDNYQKQIKELKDELNKAKQENTNNLTTSKEKTNSIVGYYKTGKLSTPRKECMNGVEDTEELQLLENGTFKRAYQSTCDSARQTGKYTYSSQKLVLTCDSNSEQCPEGTNINYTVNNDGTLTISDEEGWFVREEGDTATSKTLTRVTENDLQVLTK